MLIFFLSIFTIYVIIAKIMFWYLIFDLCGHTKVCKVHDVLMSAFFGAVWPMFILEVWDEVWDDIKQKLRLDDWWEKLMNITIYNGKSE